jgi:hypothetical protein
MGKVAAIGRDGRLMVNAQHASYSATQYAQGYISEGAVVTDDLVLYLDAADYASYPGERSLAGAWQDYASHQADYNVMGDDGVILLGTYTSWAGSFTSTTTATGNHTVMFDYWSDNDNTAWSIDNDGVNNNDYNTTLDADKKKKTFSKTVNLTSTGSMPMYMRPHSTGSKVYIANYRFFKDGTAWGNLTGKGDVTMNGSPVFNNTNDPPIHYLTFDDSDDWGKTDSTLLTAANGSPITLEAWAMTTNTSSGWQTVLGTHSSFRQIGFSGSTIKMGGNGGGGNVFLSAGTAAQSVWYHLCMTYNGTTAYAYVNGSLVTSGSIGTNSNSNGVSLIATYHSNGGLEMLEGRIAIARAYDQQLTAAEVKQNFNAERNRFGI